MELTKTTIVTTVEASYITVNKGQGNVSEFGVSSVNQTVTTTVSSTLDRKKLKAGHNNVNGEYRKIGESNYSKGYKKSDLRGKLKEKIQKAIDYHNSPNNSKEYWKWVWREMREKENKCPTKGSRPPSR